MKSIKSISIVLAISFLSISACIKSNASSDEKEEVDSLNTLSEYLGEKIEKDFEGNVVDDEGNPLKSAIIIIGGKSTMTNSNGAFTIKEATINTNAAFLKVKKEGYKDISRSIDDASNNISIILSKIDEQCLFWFCRHNHSLLN
ncbi:hypothetical protein H8K90_13635 [Winogradskyella echinorum]|uniref:CarboxypepD_reg-like domain-containing protein n=1 Tax=Winogradskyella echinorum TaxID=538189 RepID=A0ABR6Y3X3_9FLAO|nr:hypothetical protein [Winogradskyella echinorum]MBC3847432.1 hypothetical protein [Winogradskyella echinorum]MBC5751780.1 hypothetical protein [Winogradskyella echinorum]